MEMNIELKKGIGTIQFGMPVEEIVATLGTADEVESIDNPALSCIDVANDDCTLFGEPVFDLDERAIVRLMVSHDITEEDADEEDWGERRITFPQANVDFYFDQGDLVSIILGQ